MKVLNVSCNNCGAPLEVPHKTRFVTCTFCESRLEIQKTDSAYFTSVLEAVHEMKDDVETIKMQNELERIDREWSMEREGMMRTDKHGRSHVPSVANAGFVMVGGCVMGVFALNMMPSGMNMFGVVFIVISVAGGLLTLTRAKRYASRRRNYESRRRGLARELRRR
jgi:uncharacterized Zn finger protein (UPF0148 family)